MRIFVIKITPGSSAIFIPYIIQKFQIILQSYYIMWIPNVESVAHRLLVVVLMLIFYHISYGFEQ